MTQATQVAAKAVTLNVYSDAPTDLRRRLQAAPSSIVASLLPGGVILEDAPETLTYRVGSAGPWTVEQREGEIRLSNPLGQTVSVNDGQVTLTLTK